MTHSLFTKIGASMTAAATALTLSACASDSDDNADTDTIQVGTSPGPYSELFKDGIEPILEDEGFKVDYTDFSELRQADVALSEGQIDLNVDQHTAYMDVYNQETGSELTNLTDIPTVKTKIYSKSHKSIDDVDKGHTVAIPQDGSNQTRAFRLLVKLGWLTMKDDADQNLLTVNDIEDNPHDLKIQPMDSATIPRSMDDVDWGVIPGSIAYSSNVDPSLALGEEDLSDDLILQAVTTEDKKDADWAKAVIDAYKSQEFLDHVDSVNEENYWFVPDSLKK
ncbi:MetQ/NlpA family ABC transporter substrate-binding protein [Corynebacterium accolens]|uniref:MetQ/NlpA family ABC transporter substrate-binding protein n=1 Tax=Corynebacterium accolens TaxID=38284 RepID=UPI00254C293C|nr:MetQ/NlpA family ABC transporter substrate-binding protein [Corynebacterium accolens]MDK8504313.1 MetQ/NlpA family ABC transporter substrate-binding protein [Corynebacterium accolens]MDK8660572.1 MetQ/NlpA family ABC transporter substrate-binding protein [Corynebacterium accolens]